MSNESDFVENISGYYANSLDVSRDFGGPLVYFHIQTIQQQKHEFLSERHVEMIYATLALWGIAEWVTQVKLKLNWWSLTTSENRLFIKR